jgi:hypothetical protein
MTESINLLRYERNEVLGGEDANNAPNGGILALALVWVSLQACAPNYPTNKLGGAPPRSLRLSSPTDDDQWPRRSSFNEQGPTVARRQVCGRSSSFANDLAREIRRAWHRQHSSTRDTRAGASPPATTCASWLCDRSCGMHLLVGFCGGQNALYESYY